MIADSLLYDARLSGASGACCTIGIYAAVAVRGTNRVALLNPSFGQSGFYVADVVLPTAPQAVTTDGTNLYVLGVNALYIVTGASAGAPVLSIAVPVYAYAASSTMTGTTIAPWILLVNGYLVLPYGSGGVQTVTTGGVVSSILPDALSRCDWACANGSLVYVFDGARARALTLTVGITGQLTEADNGQWLAPNCRALTGAFMDGSTLVVTTDHRTVTFATTDPANPSPLATTTIAQTIRGALMVATGKYYLFTDETVAAQHQTFDLPSQGGALLGASLLVVHGPVGAVEFVRNPLATATYDVFARSARASSAAKSPSPLQTTRGSASGGSRVAGQASSRRSPVLPPAWLLSASRRSTRSSSRT